MRLFTLSIIALSLFLSTGCTQANLSMPQHDLLVIGHDTIEIEVHTVPLKEHRINLRSVVVDQSVLGIDDTKCIVYEYARVAQGYKFQYAYRRSIDLVFDAYSVKETKSYGDLTFYKVTLRDEKRTVINLLARTRSKQSLALLYGFSDAYALAIQDRLDTKEGNFDIDLASKSGESLNCIKSQWQPKLLILDGLVVKKGARVFW